MLSLPCRYTIYDGELRFDNGVVSFYKDDFGELVCESSWNREEWEELRLEKTLFNVELHLVIGAYRKEVFILNDESEQLNEWVEAAGLILEGDSHPSSAHKAPVSPPVEEWGSRQEQAPVVDWEMEPHQPDSDAVQNRTEEPEQLSW